MLSRNNFSEKLRKTEDRKQRFSIRKFSVGAASVLIGLTLFGFGTQTVKADTDVPNSQNVAEKQNSNSQSDQESNEQNKSQVADNKLSDVKNRLGGGISSLSANKLGSKAGSSSQENDKPEVNKSDEKDSTSVGQKGNAGAISGSSEKQNKPAKQSEESPKAAPESDDGDDSGTITFHVPKPGKRNPLPASQLGISLREEAEPQHLDNDGLSNAELINHWQYHWDATHHYIELTGIRTAFSDGTVVIPDADDFANANTDGGITNIPGVASGANNLSQINVTNSTYGDRQYNVYISDGDINNIVNQPNVKKFIISHTVNEQTGHLTKKVITSSQLIGAFEGPYNGSSNAHNDTLTDVDLTNLDTSNVTDMNNMFANDDALQNVYLGGLDTSHVTDMHDMFDHDDASISGLNGQGTSQLQHVYGIDGWDVSSVSNMDQMFAGNVQLKTLDLSNWNTESLTTAAQMFYRCKALTSVGDLTNWNVSNVVGDGFTGGFSGMFDGTKKLKFLDRIVDSTGHYIIVDSTGHYITVDSTHPLHPLVDRGLNKWHVGQNATSSTVISTNDMFANSGITYLNLSSWFHNSHPLLSHPSLFYANGMFENDPDLVDVGDLSAWRTDKTVTIGHMFDGDHKLTHIAGARNSDGTYNLTTYNNLSGWKTMQMVSPVFDYLTGQPDNFADASDPDLSANTVDRMAGAFANSGITYLKLTKWNIAEDGSDMFHGMGQNVIRENSSGVQTMGPVKPVKIILNQVAPMPSVNFTTGASGNLPTGPLAIIAGNDAAGSVLDSIKVNGHYLNMSGTETIDTNPLDITSGNRITYYDGSNQIGGSASPAVTAPLHFIFANENVAKSYLDQVTGKTNGANTSVYRTALGSNYSNYRVPLASPYPVFMYNFGGDAKHGDQHPELLAEELGGHWRLHGLRFNQNIVYKTSSGTTIKTATDAITGYYPGVTGVPGSESAADVNSKIDSNMPTGYDYVSGKLTAAESISSARPGAIPVIVKPHNNPTPAPTNPRPATNPAPSPNNSGSFTPSPVQPTQPSQVSQASQATNPAPTPEHNPRFVLTHNAFIYNLANKILTHKGKAIVLHRGRHITARHHGKKFTIKGKKFYQIGHNRYVKVSNTRREHYRIFKLTHNAFVYRLKGHKMIAKRLRLRHIVLKRGRHVRAWNNGNGIRVHGVTYYQIGRGRYIKAANTVPHSKSAYVEA